MNHTCNGRFIALSGGGLVPVLLYQCLRDSTAVTRGRQK